jgi:hypothetical protein
LAEGLAVKSVGVLTEGGLIETDVTVGPIILTKGLEFDAVIVANVLATSKSGTLLLRRDQGEMAVL